MAPRGGAAGNRGWARPIAGAALMVLVALMPGLAGASPASPGHPDASTITPYHVTPPPASSGGGGGAAHRSLDSNGPPPISENLTVGTPRWTLSDSGASAPPGPYTSIVYDPSISAFVAFGGEPGLYQKPATYSNQTWLFAGGHWSQVCDAEHQQQGCGTSPPARAGGLLVYDPVSQLVLMTGGFGVTSNGTAHTWRDFWTFSGSQWTNVTGAVAPEGLWDGAMIYDPGTKAVLALTDVGTTWSFAKGNWSKINSVQSPPARSHPALFYDPIRLAAILYGGVGSNGRTLNDTWAFAPGGWSKLNVGATTPTDRESVDQVHPLPIPIPSAFDTVRGVGVVVGPAGDGSNSTWIFSGDQWVNITEELGPDLPTGSGDSLAYDSVGGFGVLLDDEQSGSSSVTLYFSDPLRVVTGGLTQTLDANQSASWSPTLSAGLAPYSTQMILGQNHCTLAGPLTTGPVATCPEGTSGVDNISLEFSDFAGRQSTVNYTLTVHADPTLQVQGVHPNPTSVGVPVSFDAREAWGTAPYGAIAWSFDDGTVLHGSTPYHQFNTSGPHNVTVTMVDAVGYPVTTHYTILVNIGPSASLAVNLSETDPGLPLQFNASVAGGTGPDSCAWEFGDGTSSTLCAPVHAYPAHGQYSAKFWTNDSVGASASGNLNVSVAPRLSAVLGFLPPAYAGQSVALSANGAGGIAPYRVQWNFGDGGVATGGSVEHSYGEAGTYEAQATITDAVGGRSIIEATITVAVDGGSLLGNQSGHLETPVPSGSLHVPLEIRSADAPSTTPFLLVELLVAVLGAVLALYLGRTGTSPGRGNRRRGWMSRGFQRVLRARGPGNR